MQASSLATPGDAVPDLSPDDCQVPPSAHPMDAGAPHSDGAPLSCSDQRGEDYSQEESGLESLTSDVECFDSDSQDSDIDNYLQEVERYQGESPHLTRPARGQEDDNGVLWIHTSGNANLVPEGNKMPRAKMDGRTGPPRRRPPCWQGGKQNHRGDDQTFPLTELFQSFPLPRRMEQPPHRRGVDCTHNPSMH
eukprot:superscaffoldBa00003149_g16241